MKKLTFVLAAIMLTGLLPLTACQKDKIETSDNVTETSAAETPGVNNNYRSDENYLSVNLPDGWVAVEGPEPLVPTSHLEGQVAFNSWGDGDFWARAVHTDNTTALRYSPQIALSQIPEGGAYVALVLIQGPPPVIGSPLSADYAPDDLSGLYQPHDWRQDGGAQFIEFVKWGRGLRLEIACDPDASDATLAELNELLASWRFDTVPAGDIQWAVKQARDLLPEAVEPLKFGPQASIHNNNGVQRITELENEDNTVNVRFTYKWDSSSHWWEIQVSPEGDISLTGEGGEPLPF